MLVQEPPKCKKNSYPAFDYLWTDGRVMIARRKGSDWAVSAGDGLTRKARGDIQVLAMGRRGYQGKIIRVVNAYFQGQGREEDQRPAEEALWDDILVEDNCLVAGDFNAHSPLWNPKCTTRKNATFLEELVKSFDFQILNDDQATRPPARDEDGIHSVIDLTLAAPGAGPFCEDWRVAEEVHGLTSDHVSSTM